MTETVELLLESRVATLKLNRPAYLNAMDETLIYELLEKVKEVACSDAEILIMYGNGRAFSAGGDIKSMLLNMDDVRFERLMDAINELMLTMYSMPKLVISAIQGPAAGLGFSFALAADYIIAEPSSKLAMNFINIGLIPDGGGHYFLKQRLGEVKAKQLIWEGKKLSAHEAFALGLVDEVVSENAVAAAHEKVIEWSQKPMEAMIKTKKILTDSNRSQLIEILKMEKIGQIKMRQTAAHQEGLKAFIEKRTPVFNS